MKGKKIEALDLPESVFGVKWNADLVHQVVQSLMSNKRKGTAQAKGRGDVSGGGKKPWRQKGTGRARHGSIRSPIWVGGGVTHGPLSEKNYARKINKKAKRKAVLMVLAKKNADGEVLVIDEVILAEGKTKKAKEALEALGRIKGFEDFGKMGTKLLVTPKDRKTLLAFRNMAGVKTMEGRNLNALDALSVKYLVLGREDILNMAKV